jgi:uncharacterized membrane protein YheB (UPF0754 family)
MSSSSSSSQDAWWLYAIMPVLSALVGFVTNVIALKMTFYPVEFVGIKVWQPEDSPFGFFGWQGIIPAKAAKMAAKSIDLMTSKLINVKDVFSRLDALEMARALEPGLLAMLDKLVNRLAQQFAGPRWDDLPEDVRDEVVLKALGQTPLFLDRFMKDVKDDIDNVLDLHDMVVKNMVKNKSLLNNIFLTVGEKEITFIERSGLYFGFLFGILQTILWLFYKGSWVLPVGGFLVGSATNWLALKMIFEPVRPREVCCGRFTVQGLFMMRQHEVSAVFASVVSRDILTSVAMWESILNGPKRHIFEGKCKLHAHAFVDDMVGTALRPFLMRLMGAEAFHSLKEAIAEGMLEGLPSVIRFGHQYTTSALDMETTLREGMQALSPEDFEGVLHPVFEEDELKLIVVGGGLGAAVGVFQLLVMF